MKRHLKPVLLIESESSLEQSKAGLEGRSATQWVQMIELPDPFSYDQALLLDRYSGDEWIAWVPDYGEVMLHISEFYFAHDRN
jgi:hypothetical protein